MLYVGYLILAVLVVLFAVKCGDYVDLIDKKSNLSGAFIGGVILAAVTSLPELFTSLSATLWLHQPELVMGNIFGSNLFNLAVLGFLILISARKFLTAYVAASHRRVLGLCLVIYLLVAIYVWFCGGARWLSWIPTAAILFIYAYAIRDMSGDSGGEDDKEDNSPLTLQQVVFRFVIVAVCLVVASIIITQVSDKISDALSLGKTFAGALLLGVVTSLPELASCIVLLRRNNYNAMAGNLIGSCIFNCTIMSLCDIVTFSDPIYSNSGSSMLLIGCLVVSTLASFCLLHEKKRDAARLPVTAVTTGVCVAAYLVFLIWGR